MNKIQKIKKEVRRKEWAEQVRECQNSGLSVREWCQQNGINVYTYYRRLRKFRNELLDQAEECHPIVPISISSEISKNSTVEQATKQVAAEPDSKIMMRKDGIEIELPESISEETILMLLRGLKEC